MCVCVCVCVCVCAISSIIELGGGGQSTVEWKQPKTVAEQYFRENSVTVSSTSHP